MGPGALALIGGAAFFKAAAKARHPFVNFALFRNSTYTGATISNFMLSGVVGMLLVSMMLVQGGGGLSTQDAGMLTLGYAIASGSDRSLRWLDGAVTSARRQDNVAVRGPR